MASHPKSSRQDLVDRVADLIRERLAGDRAGVAEALLRLYARVMPPPDLEEMEPGQLYGVVVSLLSFARHRKPKQAKVRVFNPRIDEDGYTTDHTVVELVSDDMPFTVDSVVASLSSMGLNVLVVVHPVLHARRSADGTLLELLDPDAPLGKGCGMESVVHIEIFEQSDPKIIGIIVQDLEAILRDVRQAVEDWKPVQERVQAVTSEVSREKSPKTTAGEDVQDVCDFLGWLADNHFTFLGYRHYDLKRKAGSDAAFVAEVGEGLGILRNADYLVFDEVRNPSDLPPEMVAFASHANRLLITKSNRLSRVHRAVPMDVICVKRFGAGGKVSGIEMFVGLFTSNVYTNSAGFVPVLRTKIDRIMRRTGLRSGSHDGKRLLSILENLPRDELFQARDEELEKISVGILHLQDRHRTAVFMRIDEFGRFVSVLVFVPRDRFDTDLRLTIRRILEENLDAEQTGYYTQVTDAPLARLHVLLKARGKKGTLPSFDLEAIERQISEAARAWPDQFQEAILQAKGEERGSRLVRRYGNAFPNFYKERYSATAAVYDIDRIEEALGGTLALNLYRPLEAAENEVRFKVYRADKPVLLSDILPMMENMGFRVSGEMPFRVKLEDLKRSVWIHEFSMSSADGTPVRVNEIRAAFHDAFQRVWAGDIDDDGFNCLVVTTGLLWREVVMLRAYAKYLRQAAFTFSQGTISATMVKNGLIARQLVRLFHARFDPVGASGDTEILTRKILESLEQVSSSDEDRIIRRFLNLIHCTLRTNFYQKAADGNPKSYVSFKIDSRRVEDLPLPRPNVEVWVYSPRVEAIHLRGGKVARGGIRWSDRREDFRTEILGLIKAQMVKNAVIVPVGSKGGFVVKKPPAEGGREAYMAEGIECYRTLMRGLLDITDNLAGAEVVPPSDVVRHDEDDPYLVVAADKGTATFSDIANGVSAEYGFWLDDAFASGGSQGYDHKIMGITARGAWEAVKRHFREMGRDTQTQNFTCIGVGDMSGDVFGNGMLLSRHIRLLAAFNHMHIFIDPNPDPKTSYQERDRMFRLPRSTWADYNASLISEGGGIFERAAKKIPVSPQMRTLFGIEAETLTPNELILILLKADVDLLWFGGIGTYIKASTETNAEAGDRANDAIRVNGKEIRAKVIGEGANLGITQRGRIEMANSGVRMNTDAIDNSAGVDCSDHEVNIKILVNRVVADGDMTLKQRNALLADMTDEVAELVLRDNYLQTQAVSLAQYRGGGLLDQQSRLMRMLEKAGRLDRGIEYLPDDLEIAERIAARRSMVRPELAVLIAYSKMWLFDEILESDLPDDPSMEEDLISYFPERLRGPWVRQILEHKLRREIIATHAANSMINRVGGTFVTQIMEKTGARPADVARAYIVIRDAFGLRALWNEVEALDNKAPADAQLAILTESNRLVERGTLWVLRHGDHVTSDQGALTATLREGAEALAGSVSSACPPDLQAIIQSRKLDLTAKGVPVALADRTASLVLLASVPDVVRLSRDLGVTEVRAAAQYFAVGSRFGLGWLRAASENLTQGSHWEKLAAAAVTDELYALQRGVTARILGETSDSLSPIDAIDTWSGNYKAAVLRTDQLLIEMRSSPSVDLAMLTVASRQFGSLAGV